MSFLWPAGLAALAAVPAAILIALWRARRRDIVVPSTLLWKRLEERIADSGRRRRKLVDFALAAAALSALFLATAAAGPLLRRQTPQTPNILLIVDVSASMAIRENGETRLHAALQELDALLHKIGTANLYLGTVPADASAAASGIYETSIAGLQQLRPVFRPANLEREIARILAAAANIRPFETLVVTDQPDAVPQGIAVSGVGGSVQNLFFSRFGYSDESVLFGLRDTSGGRQSVLQVLADGELIRRLNPSGDSGEQTLVVRHEALRDAAVLEARIETDDALATDNMLYAVRQPERKIRVLLAGRENQFIEAALKLHPSVEIVRSASSTPDGGGESNIQQADTFDLAIYNGITPGEEPSTAAPSHRIVVIDPPQSFEGVTVDGNMAEPVISSFPGDAASFGLADVSVKRARSIAMQGNVIAASGDGKPLIVRQKIPPNADRQARDITVIAFRLGRDNTDWMLQTGFPVFWARMLEEIGPTRPQGFAFNKLGECVVIPAGKKAVLRRLRPVEEYIKTIETGEFLFCPELPGVYEIRTESDTHLMAFNFFDAEESSQNGRKQRVDTENFFSPAAVIETKEHSLLYAAALIGLAFMFTYWYYKQ